MKERKNLVNEIMRWREGRYSSVCWRIENLAEKKWKTVFEEYESESSWHPAVQSFCRCHQTKSQGAQLEAAVTCTDPEVYLYHLLQKYQSRGARQTPGDVHTEKSHRTGKKLQLGKTNLSKMNSWCCQKEQSFWGGPSAGPGAASLSFSEHPEQPCSQVGPPVFTLKCLTSGLIFKLTAAFQAFQ